MTCRSLLANTEELSVLLGSHQGDDGVWAHSEVVRRETGPEASDALLSHRLHDAVRHALVGHHTLGVSLLLLHLGLYVVEGKGADGSGDSSDHRAAKIDSHGGSFRAQRLSCNLLRRVVRDEHAHVEGDSSGHGRYGTSPESKDTFVSDNTRESVHDVLVVAALGLGQSRVSLHPDEGQIARVANKGAKRAGKERRLRPLEHSEIASVVLVGLHPLSEVEVDAETKRAVDDLSKQG